MNACSGNALRRQFDSEGTMSYRVGCLVFLALAVAGVLCLTPSTAQAGLITPGHGVTVYQIDFRGGFDSNVGQIIVDRAQINGASGLTSGYVNVADSSGSWLVRNLPVFDCSISDAAKMSTHFNLTGVANGQDVSSFNLYVDYSSLPVSSFSGGSTSGYSVSSIKNALGDLSNPPVVNGYRPGPDHSSVSFAPTGLTYLVYQNKHSNVQAADSQCAPAAVANSLAYLKDAKGLPVPDPNIPGLRDDKSPGDTSLVGKLEKLMDRPVTDRQHGGGVWPLDGKLEYLADTGLASLLVVKHMGGGEDGMGNNLDGTQNYTAHGVTSHGQGATVTWAWIKNELDNGEDVELEYNYRVSEGGHYVDVIGAGILWGQPFILHVSDQVQADMDPTDTLGCDTIQMDYMVGTFLNNENADVFQAISQSVIPEPGTLSLVGLSGLALMLRRRRRRR